MSTLWLRIGIAPYMHFVALGVLVTGDAGLTISDFILGQQVWGEKGRDPVINGTAIDMNANDHRVDRGVIFVTGIGMFNRGASIHISGVVSETKFAVHDSTDDVRPVCTNNAIAHVRSISLARVGRSFQTGKTATMPRLAACTNCQTVLPTWLLATDGSLSSQTIVSNETSLLDLVLLSSVFAVDDDCL
jgi:hypothetical protein